MTSHAEQEPAAPNTAPSAASQTSDAPKTPASHRTVEKSRTGYTWVGLIVAALIGVIVLIFILQNLNQQRLDLLFWNFSLPVGILVLLSVITGALVMALVGGVRIFQLRRAVKR